MGKKIYVNPGFDFLRDYIEDVPEKFDSLGEVVYAQRNVVRKDTVGDRVVVIKSYRKIYLANRIRYSFFYPSKAERAHDYGVMLLQKGFHTPKPIAFIECYKHGLITQSYFISEYTDFKPLNSILTDPPHDLERLLKDFAAYTYRLHQNNIYHIDYSTGNILFKRFGERYVFALIDNNRMKFGRIGFNTGIRNLERLRLPVELLTSIGKEYARLNDVDEVICMERLFHYRRNQMRKRSLKRYGKQLWSRFQHSIYHLFSDIRTCR